MPYYPHNQRRSAFSQVPRRGAVPPSYRQNFGPPNEMRRPDNQYMYNQQQPQGYAQGFPQGYPQQQTQGFPQLESRRRLPDMNRMMDHASKISEGINIVRQIGALFNFYR